MIFYWFYHFLIRTYAISLEFHNIPKILHYNCTISLHEQLEIPRVHSHRTKARTKAIKIKSKTDQRIKHKHQRKNSLPLPPTVNWP